MEGQKVDFKEAQNAVDGGEDRNRSSIRFPYGDLDDAVAVALALWKNTGGEECSRDQLAAFLHQTPTSGAYRLKLATAANFGLVKSAQGKVRLTELGRDIVDAEKAREARVRAFYFVPLYKALYERFQGYSLPPIAALERTIIELGVSPKQADTARQVFQRSAQQAGFFEHGNNRLVEPVIRTGDKPSQPKPDDANAKPPNGGSGGAGGGGGSIGGDLDPFIQGLVNKLPKGDATSWSPKERLKWLQTAAAIFALVYGGDENDEIEVRFKNVQGQGQQQG